MTTVGNQQIIKTIQRCISSNYSSSTFVLFIREGDGSGAFATYYAFADNVTSGTIAGGTTYIFELPSAIGAVPEPAARAMVFAGFGSIGGAMHRRSRR